jgi:glutaredoxin
MSDEIFPEIRSTQYTVFTKSGCKYCDNIKILMEQEKEDVIYILCDDILISNRQLFIDFIKQNAKIEKVTFPIVFYDGNYVGGCDDYNEKIKQRCFTDLDTEF